MKNNITIKKVSKNNTKIDKGSFVTLGGCRLNSIIGKDGSLYELSFLHIELLLCYECYKTFDSQN